MVEVGDQPLQNNQTLVLQYVTNSDDVLLLFNGKGDYERRCADVGTSLSLSLSLSLRARDNEHKRLRVYVHEAGMVTRIMQITLFLLFHTSGVAVAQNGDENLSFNTSSQMCSLELMKKARESGRDLQQQDDLECTDELSYHIGLIELLAAVCCVALSAADAVPS